MKGQSSKNSFHTHINKTKKNPDFQKTEPQQLGQENKELREYFYSYFVNKVVENCLSKRVVE